MRTVYGTVESMEYTIYTDGSCRVNPGGRGGTGAVIFAKGKEVARRSQGYRATTNNRMELQAIVDVLEAYRGKTLEIWTDSKYAKQGITVWMSGWKERGWKKSSAGPIKNLDLWKKIDALVTDKVSFHWVKAHGDNEWNALADELATMAAARGPYAKDEGYGG